MNQTVTIILDHPSHPGNIGSCARAMKVMGLSRLVLVAPKLFPHATATALATGAADVLQAAVVVETLAEALVGCTRVYATTARSRALDYVFCTPREAALEIASTNTSSTAIIFGCERAGLSNDDLTLCHAIIQIPTADEFHSFNLAQAVQIISYEIGLMFLNQPTQITSEDDLACMSTVRGFLDHLEDVLFKLKFLKSGQSSKMMRRLSRLFNRSNLTVTEINILRGILSDITYALEHPNVVT